MTTQPASAVVARSAERIPGSGRAGWLRAAVLGANDGLVSTASIMVGMAASHAGSGTALTAGIAGVAAGAMGMAAGEYVSVSSQVDVERADVEAEARQQARDPIGELAELADIYEQRGLPRALAERVAGGAVLRPTLRVVAWGSIAMLVTAGVGQAVHGVGI